MSNKSLKLFDRLATESIDVALWMSMIACGRELGEMTVDHGARMDISREHAVPHLLEAYKRSKALTSTLLFVGGLSGLMAFYKTKDTYWLVGSGFLLAGLPYSRFLENPIIEQLSVFRSDAKSERAGSLLNSWGIIQAGKFALSFGGAFVYYWFARHH